MPNIQDIRAQFPSLASTTVFLDNAGGSQVPRGVAEAVERYYHQSCAQLGGEYPESVEAAAVVGDAHALMGRWANASGPDNVILGASDSLLVRMLADAYLDAEPSNDRRQIIVSPHGHESNVGPWLRLARFGWEITPWNDLPVADDGYARSIEPLLSARTRLVVFPHVSNILGSIVDVRAIADRVHAAGGRVVVDGVAFAPHRPVEVSAFGADWYSWSTYKVYGPHAAVLVGTSEAMAEVTGPNHFFIEKDSWPKKFELGGVPRELCAAMLGVQPYLRFLAGSAACGSDQPLVDRSTIERACIQMARLEAPLQEQLIHGLREIGGVRVVGPLDTGESRVPTVSFTVDGLSSRTIAERANREGLGLRYGHFYSHRLVEHLLPGRDPEDGVVRISLLHYNTPEEVARAIEFVSRVARC
ncbi:MAG: aminotransferase class V-fold PLP-dependent enzyme [Phycisphaerales bacterium]|nr:aminotransferase class V-fold PLP-dependent enzyme [Phycisphaerales bacterium]